MTTRYKAPVAPRHYIKEWLSELRVKNQELADLMNTDKSNVTRWISEPRRVNLDVLTGISMALRDRFPEMQEPGNLLKSPQKVRALDQMRHAAEIIAGEPSQPGRRK